MSGNSTMTYSHPAIIYKSHISLIHTYRLRRFSVNSMYSLGQKMGSSLKSPKPYEEQTIQYTKNTFRKYTCEKFSGSILQKRMRLPIFVTTVHIKRFKRDPQS